MKQLSKYEDTSLGCLYSLAPGKKMEKTFNQKIPTELGLN